MTGLPPTDGPLTPEELQQATTRNRGMPLEGLRYDITPIGMHYLLIHSDIPETDAQTHTVTSGGNGRARLKPRATRSRSSSRGTTRGWRTTSCRP